MTNDKTKHAHLPHSYSRGKDGCDEVYDIIAEDAETILASLPFWDDEDGSIEATARLFAASAKLLAALEDLANQADEDCPAKCRSRHFTDALTTAREVIAQAK
jgi:hypothetical protein